MSSRWVTNTLDLPDRNQAALESLRDSKRMLRPLLAAHWQTELEALARYLPTLESNSATSPPGTDNGPPLVPPLVPTWPQLFSPTKDPLPPLEDPLHGWQRILLAARNKNGVREEWGKLRDEYTLQIQQRTAQNERDFVPIADFGRGVPTGWSLDGVGVRELVRCGDFVVPPDGDDAVRQILAAGLATHSLSPRLNGALRTPYLRQFDKAFLSFEVVGGDFAAQRTVVDNAFLTERQQYLNQATPTWLRIANPGTLKERNVYFEFATKTSNPNFPPRVGLGGACSEEQAADPKSWWGITRVVAHDAALAPADELTRFRSLWNGEDPVDFAASTALFVRWMQAAVQRWQADQATTDDVGLLNWMLQKGLVTNRLTQLPEAIQAEVARYRAGERLVLEPQTVNGMTDTDAGIEYRLNVRGDYDDLGAAIPRGFVRSITERIHPDNAESLSRFSSTTSGRRELAELVAAPGNPLTARVYINRVWQWMFGTGLVRTPDDFGHLGDLPVHAQLLDRLAVGLMEDGWSTKRLVRRMALSATWQQSGEATAAGRSQDPDNRLWHHFPLRRLEAESIRDAMLSVSGGLDRQLYGPPTNPYRTKEDPQKRLFSGPINSLARRAIYTKITIMEPPRFLAIFNQPAPKIPTGKRDISNTPAQSLALLNDPTVRDQAATWGAALAQRPSNETVGERIQVVFEAALGRPPSEEESQLWRKLANDLAELHSVAPQAMMGSALVWTDVVHSLFNLKEFIYVR